MKNDRDFKDISMSKELQFKVNKFLACENATAIFMHPENVIFMIEERILNFSENSRVFYVNIPFTLSHELRHFRQALFFGKRLDIMLSDYSIGYSELLKDNQYNKLHWCEKDAYTYSYQFTQKHKQEIMRIFNIDEWIYLLPFDYEKEWKNYKRKMGVLPQITWAVKDYLFWKKRLMN
ncbi:hypothetical protein IHQ11_23855 [Priestia megaterium]|uniref:hypothetical protein n=1 Tax=Priestia megaterium TaxID=1404 RepID=UPI001B3A2390|nr:hypothetical protein [Priestia megaterium]MBQ4869508.1 hypothetical protein [Priestia megaterium]